MLTTLIFSYLRILLLSYICAVAPFNWREKCTNRQSVLSKMRTQRCTQLAFVVLLIVTAFPHHQTQDPDDDNRRAPTAYKDDDQTHRSTPKTKTEASADSISSTTPSTKDDNEEQIETDLDRKDERCHQVTLSAEKLDSTPEKETLKELGPSDINTEPEATAKKRENSKGRRKLDGPEQREIDSAVEYGLQRMRDLYFVREPELYKMGLFLEKGHPGYFLASFRAPNDKALNYARYGYAAIQARTKLAEIYPESSSRESPATTPTLRSTVLQDECPLQGIPRCPPGFERYRTADGTCNNFRHPWRGASLLPMQRFLPPHYDDGIQSVRRSVMGGKLPSPRDISTRIHRDKHREMPTITLMFMQWGQFLDHDITSSVQARMFNRSVPRCCQEGGARMLPPEFTHPECLPISVSKSDWFLSQFGIRCIEFIRSAPTSRIDCDLGWREQISQVTAYIDASTVYGSDPDMSDSLRFFRNGQLLYGRSRNQQPLQPPDPPQGELCRLGVITTDCFRGGDLRVGDQPGLTAVHTVWLRYHNAIAVRLEALNPHWSDEKLYQEARRIVGALMQHITYREFLPIVLGQEVMRLFDLDLIRKGYYKGYSTKVNPAPANSFGTAAFRFGHSLVQHSFIRTDSSHRVIHNNVTLHEEQENIENIWSFGSMDRLLLGLANQPTQRRDEFISEELTNHLFQSSGFPFGLDLAAINVQRGRDHGLPSYTAWRKPCGLVPLRNWTDLERIMSPETVRRFRSLYDHFDDIDLFSGGLAEKPVRGGIVGPTFACIIAQQFSNLRRGDRFWYENGNFESSFTPAQLQQLRRVTFAHVLCKTTAEIETLQPFVFLSADKFRNARVRCDDPSVDSFDLKVWAEKNRESANSDQFLRKSDDFFSDFMDENNEGVIDLTEDGEERDHLEELNNHEENEQEGDEDIESRKRLNKKRKKIKPTLTSSRRRTTTKSTITRVPRPTAFINNHPLTQNTYGPYSVKLTNVTSATVNFNKKVKPGSKKRPIIVIDRTTKRPPNKVRPVSHLGNQAPPTKRPFPTERPPVDGYLIGHMPEPYPTLNTARPTVPIGSENGQMHEHGLTGGHGPYHVNINIQFTPPTGQQQTPNRVPPYDKNTFEFTTKRTKLTNRPTYVNSYGHSEQDFTKPPNRYYDSPFVTKRPSYSYNRPQNGYDHFHDTLTPANYRPVYRPPTNHETVFEDAPFATSSKPYNIYNYNTFKHKISTMRPVKIPSYLYLNDQDTDGNYDPYQQSARPTYNRRPTNPYKTDEDPTNPISDSNVHILSPQGGVPNVNYFTPQYKHERDTFKTDHASPTDVENPSETDNDKFVMISSVSGEKFATAEEMKQPLYISVQQREGELELSENDEKEESSTSPLLQIDVVPSEVRTDEWEIYNEDDDIAPALSLFDLIQFNSNIPNDSELPKPINFDNEE